MLHGHSVRQFDHMTVDRVSDNLVTHTGFCDGKSFYIALPPCRR
jgi:hypothetical protein